MTLLRPEVLARLSTLELVARSAVEGYFQGMHRSPRFGFSQEFAEYKAYSEGDDPRFVDWNVYARTDRTYIRRYIGETNTRLMIALDVSASMGYSSGAISKLRYAKFVAASLAYMALQQHDPVGLIAFDSKIRSSVRLEPQRQSEAILHRSITGTGTDRPSESLRQLREHRQRDWRRIDLYRDRIADAASPLAWRGHDIMILQVLDRAELEPAWQESVLLQDVESGRELEVSPDYLRTTYRERIAAHLARVKQVAAGCGADHALLVTDEPLDQALRRYLLFRQRS
jgi:uncharacterized protein (DUF58 family)